MSHSVLALLNVKSAHQHMKRHIVLEILFIEI